MAKYSEHELDELLELERLCYAPQDAYSKEFLRFLLQVSDAHLVRRYSGSRLIGFQLSHLSRGELITLDVHPDFRHRGIGSQLLGETLAAMRRIHQDHVYCMISVENQSSIALHQKFGFEVDGVLPDYYGKGRDAYLLSIMFEPSSDVEPPLEDSPS